MKALIVAAAIWSLLSDRRRRTPGSGSAGSSTTPLPSLEIVAEKVTVERQIRLATYDALSVKAGVVAMASVTVAALTAIGKGALLQPGLVCATIALLLSLVAQWPRNLNQFKARKVRNRYLTQTRQVALLRILDTEVDAVEKIARWNRILAIVTMVSMAFLAVSTILLVAAVIR